MATTRHKSLDERGGREAFLETKKGLAPKKKFTKKSIFTNLNKRIRAKKASSITTRLFLAK